MPLIRLETKVRASKKSVFDLSRSIDFHQLSTYKTKEKAIAGRTSGLIELNETVTWRAKHLGVYQKLTSKITAMNPYESFIDEMEKGIFKSIHHKHLFSHENGVTTMIDEFNYESPLGILGKVADKIFLEKYMTNFLIRRNKLIKLHAENK